jgi:uncharacterized RDD family membrane protein YckC
MSKAQDPREIITPDAFSVARELLGLPLAHPWRRAAAILIDLALIGLLANAKGVLLALAGGTFLFWIAFRGRKAGLGSTLARGTVGCAGAVFVFVAVIAIWGTVFLDEDTQLFEVETGEGQSVPVTLGAAADLLSVLGTEDSVEAEEAATRILRDLEEQGVAGEQLRSVVDDLRDGADDANLRAVERAMGSIVQESEQVVPEGLDVDSLLAAYAEARVAGDTLAERELGGLLGPRVAAVEWDRSQERISRLEDRNDRLAAELSETERELEEERDRGLIGTLIGFLDELGLGIGWSGLYFTFLTAFFRGRTPGKRALGIRVLRLDGSALSYWVAFERFGGYAASLFTGMEGFVRILWDRNRQCLQDKLAETVVIRETREARAQLAVGAAKRATSDQPWKGSPITGS